MLSERVSQKRIYTILSPLSKTQGKCKLIYSDRRQISNCLGKDGWKGGGKERQMEGRKEGREETGKSHSVPQGMTSSSTLFLRLETFLFLIHMNCVTRTFSHHSQPLLSVTISLCPVSDSLPAPFFYSAARDILGQRGNILTMSKAQLTNLTSSEGKPP